MFDFKNIEEELTKKENKSNKSLYNAQNTEYLKAFVVINPNNSNIPDTTFTYIKNLQQQLAPKQAKL